MTEIDKALLLEKLSNWFRLIKSLIEKPMWMLFLKKLFMFLSFDSVFRCQNIFKKEI